MKKAIGLGIIVFVVATTIIVLALPSKAEPNVVFKELDTCFEKFQENKEMSRNCGDFKGWIVPQLREARIAGIKANEIDARLEQIFEWANQDKFFSGELWEAADKSGRRGLNRIYTLAKIAIYSDSL